MYHLNRSEEEILLTIWDLKQDAYLVAIREQINKTLGKKLTVGAVHIPLTRLERAGIIESRFGEATPKRGGRRKRIYKLTKQGIEVLKEYKKKRDKLWAGFSEEVITR
jgi:DNA-binding PadR family transcriptional regulator